MAGLFPNIRTSLKPAFRHFSLVSCEFPFERGGFAERPTIVGEAQY